MVALSPTKIGREHTLWRVAMKYCLTAQYSNKLSGYWIFGPTQSIKIAESWLFPYYLPHLLGLVVWDAYLSEILLHGIGCFPLFPEGAGGEVLGLDNVQARRDSGDYTCQARNILGVDQAVASLNVLGELMLAFLV